MDELSDDPGNETSDDGPDDVPHGNPLLCRIVFWQTNLKPEKLLGTLGAPIERPLSKIDRLRRVPPPG
jgi:hypothetical protein